MGGIKVMNIRKIFILCVLLCSMACVINGCGSSNKPTKIEDEIVVYLNQLSDKYGEIGYDAQYIYCDGEYQYFIIYYYGTGANTKVADTTAVYRVDANGNSELYIDLMEKKVEIESEFDKVLLAMCEDTYNQYKDNKQELTYEEFRKFEKGYIKVDFDILHEMMKKED